MQQPFPCCQRAEPRAYSPVLKRSLFRLHTCPCRPSGSVGSQGPRKGFLKNKTQGPRHVTHKQQARVRGRHALQSSSARRQRLSLHQHRSVCPRPDHPGTQGPHQFSKETATATRGPPPKCDVITVSLHDRSFLLFHDRVFVFLSDRVCLLLNKILMSLSLSELSDDGTDR